MIILEDNPPKKNLFISKNQNSNISLINSANNLKELQKLMDIKMAQDYIEERASRHELILFSCFLLIFVVYAVYIILKSKSII